MFGVRATTKFTRDWIFRVADSIDLDDVAIFFPETTVSFQDITRISFVIFGKRNCVVLLYPLIDLVFDLFFLFIGEFAIEIKVKT